MEAYLYSFTCTLTSRQYTITCSIITVRLIKETSTVNEFLTKNLIPRYLKLLTQGTIWLSKYKEQPLNITLPEQLYTYAYSFWTLTLSPPISLKLYTLPYWSNPSCLVFDIRTLWRSGLSARASECQKLKMAGYTSMALDPSNSSNLEQLALKRLIGVTVEYSLLAVRVYCSAHYAMRGWPIAVASPWGWIRSSTTTPACWPWVDPSTFFSRLFFYFVHEYFAYVCKVSSRTYAYVYCTLSTVSFFTYMMHATHILHFRTFVSSMLVAFTALLGLVPLTKPVVYTFSARAHTHNFIHSFIHVLPPLR